jgi:hypothetical protein
LNEDAGFSIITVTKSTAVDYAADDYLFREDMDNYDSMRSLVSNETIKVDIIKADIIEDDLIRPVKVGSDITGTDISLANRSAVLSDADKISEDIIFKNVIDAVLENTYLIDFDTRITGSDSTHTESDSYLCECNIKVKTVGNRIDGKKIYKCI